MCHVSSISMTEKSAEAENIYKVFLLKLNKSAYTKAVKATTNVVSAGEVYCQGDMIYEAHRHKTFPVEYTYSHMTAQFITQSHQKPIISSLKVI